MCPTDCWPGNWSYCHETKPFADFWGPETSADIGTPDAAVSDGLAPDVTIADASSSDAPVADAGSAPDSAPDIAIDVSTVSGTWKKFDAPASYSLHGLWGAAADQIVAVGEQGAIVFFDGKVWNAVQNSPTFQWLRAVWGTGYKDIWVVGESTTLLHFDGATWSKADLAATGGGWRVAGRAWLGHG